MSKDETRQNFSCLVGNLPNISKKPRRKAQPFTVANKKVKRKASIPPPPKNLRLAQSQGASIIKVDTDSIHEGAQTATAAHTSANISVTKMASTHYPSYFYTPKENVFDSKRGSRYDKGQPKSFHLTQPDSNFAKFVFASQEPKPSVIGDSQSVVNYDTRPHGQFASIYSTANAKSPKSMAAYKTGSAAHRGLMASNHSIDSDNTIQAFLMKDSCGQIVKTKKVLEREQDRIEKVKRVRDKAIANELEKSAKLILKERRYMSNTKRHEKEQIDIENDRSQAIQDVIDKRTNVRQITLEKDAELDDKGYSRYRKDHREVEQQMEKIKNQQLYNAEESYLKLRSSMEITEKQQRDAIVDFNKSADEAKMTLHGLEKKIQARKEMAVRTFEKVSEKVQQNNFELQKINYDKKKEIEEEHQNHFSELAVTKFQKQQKKHREIRENTNRTIENH